MKIGHIADVHLGYRQYGLKQREEDGFLTFESTLGQLADEGVDAILIPGDLFDDRDLRPKVLQRTEAILQALDVPVLVSPGNHDQNLHPRDVTWLKYLHDKGRIVLLSADLTTDVAGFERVDLDEPWEGGGGYVDLPGPDGPVRVFGLQYRGAYVETALRQAAKGIREVNEYEGEPARTILMAHFGVTEVVPDLGANVSFADLDPIEDLVDYLALGHIHKQYEAEDWIYNPGSPEALDIQEGRWDDEHGYYVLEVSEDGIDADHHLSKRRPYVTTEFSVSDHATFEGLAQDLREQMQANRPDVDETCQRDIHTARGERRPPIVNLRLKGTLLLDRPAFDVERVQEVTAQELDALYVRPTDETETKAIQELVEGLDEDEVFRADGTINHDPLEERVFRTIAEESRYSEHPEAAADVLGRVEDMVNEDGAGVQSVAEYVQERRRALFPEGARTATGDDTTSEAGGDPE
jgi:DNA repair exonuclease SbcCD nuclease subunit